MSDYRTNVSNWFSCKSLKQCKNYRTISQISKIILKIILNRLMPQAEEIITEKHTGIQWRRHITEEINNL